MKSTKILTFVAATALVTAAAVGSAFAQGQAKSDYPVGTGGWPGSWDVRTNASANCPSMNMHIVRSRSDNKLTGVASTGDMTAFSRISGTVDRDKGVFNLDVTPVESAGPKGTVSGTVDSVTNMINAKLSGFGCQDRQIRIRYTEPDPANDRN
jgi:hypothetical protein